MTVLTTPESRFVDAANEIAALRDERVVTELDDVGSEPVVYVDAPDAIDESVVLALQMRLFEETPNDGAFSLVTGYRPEEAVAFYDRNEPGDGEHALLSARPPETHPNDESLLLSRTRKTTLADLEPFTETRTDSLSLGGSGWPMHVQLADGWLCGLPESAADVEFPGRTPYCVEDGARSCPFDEDILPADELDVRHVFLSSCAPVLANNVPGLPAHIGTALLTRAESVLGSYRQRFSAPHEPLFNYSLLRAGYTLAERCYVLNRGAHAANYEFHPHVPLGRPDAALDAPPQQYELSTSHSDGVVLEFSDVDAHVLDVTVPRDAFPGTTDSYYVRNVGESDLDSLRYAAFEEDDRVRVLVYAGGRLTGRFEFQLADAPADADRMARLRESVAGAQRQADLGALGETARGRIRDFRKSIHDFGDERYTERTNPDVYREVLRELDALEDDVRPVRNTLVDRYTGHGMPLDVYGDRVIHQDTYGSEIVCPDCDRHLVVKELATAIGDARRAIGVCDKHAVIFDVPTAAGDADPPHPRIVTDLLDTDADRRPVTVAFENPTEAPMTGTIVPTLPYASGADETRFDPGNVEFEAGPGEPIEATFELDVTGMHPNQHALDVYVFGNLELYAARTTVLVGEDGGWRPHVD